MENALTKIRDSFVKESSKTLSSKQISIVSAIINNLISLPCLLEERINSGKDENLEKDREKIDLVYDIMYEITTNTNFVSAILSEEEKVKRGEVFKIKMLEELYKNRFA